MTIGIITVRDRNYHPNRRLIEAAGRKGHRVDLIDPYRVWPALVGDDKAFVSQGIGAWKPPDVVLPRQGAAIGESSLAVIRHFASIGIPLINGPEAIRLARNQFFSLQAFAAAGIPFPDTIFINAMDGFCRAVDQLGGFPVVIKQVSGRQGDGVCLVTGDKATEAMIQTHLDAYFGLLVQRFIPTDARTDIRVLMVGGDVIGALALQPKPDDFRANYHLTEAGEPLTLSNELKRVAGQAANAVGLEIAGIDLVVSEAYGINVIEVNYAPGFRGMEAVTGVDVASTIVDYATKRFAAG